MPAPRIARAVMLLLVAAMLCTAGTLTRPQAADAATMRAVHNCVDVYVRASPTGAIIGTLYEGEHMLVYNTVGNYHYGFAYGSVNQWGYALASCFWNGP